MRMTTAMAAILVATTLVVSATFFSGAQAAARMACAEAECAGNPSGTPVPDEGEDFDDGFDEYDDVFVNDPVEGFNRAMFGFNEVVYKGVFRPLSKGYDAVVPDKAQSGVSNFFTNLMAPVRFLNCVFQGRFKDAGMEGSKFLANTAFGFGGLMDVTKGRKRMYPVNENGADFGQTLAVWGWDSETYLVLPLLGPSTPRDGLGMAADLWADPTFHVTKLWQSVAIKSAERTNAFALGEGDEIDRVFEEIDPYAAARNAWWQRRQEQVAGRIPLNGTPSGPDR